MKKTIILIVFSVAVLIAYRAYNKAPTFEGPNAAVKKLIWQFNRSDSLSDKAKFAIHQMPFLSYEKLIEGDDFDFNEDEVSSLKEMFEFKVGTMKLLEDLIRSLDQNEIDQVTVANPLSIYTTSGMLTIPPVKTKDCSDSIIKRMEEYMGSDKFFDRGFKVVAYMNFREMKFMNKYYKEIDKLSSTEKYSDYSELNKTYFPFIRKYSDKPLEISPHEKKIRKELILKGLNKETLDFDLYKIAQVAPECFLNMFLFKKKFKKMKVLHLGNKILDVLNAYVIKSGSLPSELQDIFDDSADKSLMDESWKYEIKKVGDKSTLVFTNYTDEDTDDDVVIGDVVLPAE